MVQSTWRSRMQRPSVRRRAALTCAALTVVAGLLALAPDVGPAQDVIGGAPVVVAAADATRVELVPGSTEARYRAQEVLSGYGVNEPVGRTSEATGAVLLDETGAV